MKSELLKQDSALAQDLSALRDGEVHGHVVVAACAAWAEDGALAEDWQLWSLIGDVMRSDEMVGSPQAETAFLQAVRRRLQDEPVVLAPERRPVDGSPPAWTPAAEGLSWVGRSLHTTTRRFAGAAVAVGAVAVLGVMVLGRFEPAGQVTGPELAQAQTVSDDLQASPVMVMRSADLDRYLNAHRQFAQGPALAGPGGVRQVALTPDGR
jgi:sigma-E factor negative regulatory protein RseA